MLKQPQQLADERAIPVVVVEDEPLVRLVATDILREAGFRVLEAGNADEALVLIEARPDARVIITDVRMPGSLDGFALAHLAAKRWPGIGIVVTSGHALPDKGDLPDGATFLSKPWRPATLIEQVHRLLEQDR